MAQVSSIISTSTSFEPSNSNFNSQFPAYILPPHLPTNNPLPPESRQKSRRAQFRPANPHSPHLHRPPHPLPGSSLPLLTTPFPETLLPPRRPHSGNRVLSRPNRTSQIQRRRISPECGRRSQCYRFDRVYVGRTLLDAGMYCCGLFV